MSPTEYCTVVEALDAVRHTVADWACYAEDQDAKAATRLRCALAELDAAYARLLHAPLGTERGVHI